MNRAEKAVRMMRDGNNCGMAVLAAFAEDYGVAGDLAVRIGRPLGAGMGMMGLTCGAVSAGFLVLGLAAEQGQEEAKMRPELYSQVRDMARRFEERNEGIACKGLLGLDLATEEGLAEFKDRNMMETHCQKFVRDTAEILEEMGLIR